MSFLDKMLNPEINKTAMEAVGTDANDTFERKVVAHPWVNEVLELDADLIDKEYQANLAAEAKLLGKTAALCDRCDNSESKAVIDEAYDYLCETCRADRKEIVIDKAEATMMNHYQMSCKSVGNPDHEQYAPVSNPELITGSSLIEIREKAMSYIEKWELGGGNWPECAVTLNGKKIATMSYNGRFWPLEKRWEDLKEQTGYSIDLKKKAAYEQGETPKETIEKDYARDVKILSDYALAEMLAELRCSKAQNTAEMFAEAKEKAKKEISSSREKAEKALLELTPDHTMLDWQKAFDRFSKDAKPEEVKEKDLYKPEVPEKEYNMDSPKEDKFKMPTKEEMIPVGNGREADERAEVTKQAVPVIKEAALEAPIVEPVSPLKREEELPVEIKADKLCHECQYGNHEDCLKGACGCSCIRPENKEAHCGSCPVCGGAGNDLKNNEKDHISCMACGITYGETVPEIKSQASKEEVLKKVAELNKESEVQSPWVVIEKDGQEMIARRDVSQTNEKISEEDKEEEIKK
jgi:hypothetical protein